MDYKKRSINPDEMPTRDFHQFLLGSVAPRPIAFVSTINEKGDANLAPYSFFNVFSSNPPIAVFSSNRRVTNNTTKDTLANILATKKAVINTVDFSIVRQMAIASVEFPSDVSEFEKTGLTMEPAEILDVPMVKEAPASMECEVDQVITLGEHGGAGHLIVCKILRLHVRESAIDEKGRIDPHKMDLMGRMGRAFYCRASGENVFPIVQAVTKICIGWDALPEDIRKSEILSGNEISLLAGQHELPTEDEKDDIKALNFGSEPKRHEWIKERLGEGRIREALSVAFLNN